MTKPATSSLEDRPLRATFHCRHYSCTPGWNGGPVCAAGVKLEFGNGSVSPCMPAPYTGSCPLRADYTDAERAAWDEWVTKRSARTMRIMAAIPQDGWEGSMACPGCGTGTVHWGRARRNRHIHAACSTPGCFAVMQ